PASCRGFCQFLLVSSRERHHSRAIRVESAASNSNLAGNKARSAICTYRDDPRLSTKSVPKKIAHARIFGRIVFHSTPLALPRFRLSFTLLYFALPQNSNITEPR